MAMELTLEQALQKGVEAHKAGQVQEADHLYTAILKAQPKHPDANHNMGVLAVGVGKVHEALPFFKTALEANPGTAQFWLSYIDALIKLNRISDAKELFDQVKSNGAKGEAFDDLEKIFSQTVQNVVSLAGKNLLDRAINLRERGKLEDAIDLLKEGINQFPENVDMLALVSHCYILNDDLDAATIYLDKATSINPDNASVGWNKVRLLLKSKNVADALDVARCTNNIFPDDVEGMGVLGSCLRTSNNLEESLVYLNKAIKLKPNHAEVLINRGLIRLTQKDNTNALADLQQAHKLKPHIKQIWDPVISLLVETEQYSKAILLLINMIEIDPNREKSFSLLAACNQKSDDIDLALKSFEKVLEVKPNDASMHVNLGIVLKQKGNLDEAIAAFNKALAIKPDFAQAYYNIGVILQAQGRLEEAIDAYNKALAIKPDTADIYNNMGVALKDQGKLEKAMEAFNKALAIKPDTAEVYNSMGNALQAQGNLEEAIEAFNKALAIQPEFAEAKLALINLLTIYIPQKDVYHNIVGTNRKIRKIPITDNRSSIITDITVINLLTKSFNYILNSDPSLRTKNNQIYRRNTQNLNCRRHKSIFKQYDIIPEFCFGCYKVQVEPRSIIELVKLFLVFDQIVFDENNTRKCMTELRPGVPGFYKGLVYCQGLDQANRISEFLDPILKKKIGSGLHSKVKRGCSEYSNFLPNYGEINDFGPQLMNYNKDWTVIEQEYDKMKSEQITANNSLSISGVNLSDILIIQKWIDYSKGIGDPSSKMLKQHKVFYEDYYNKAKLRLDEFSFVQ